MITFPALLPFVLTLLALSIVFIFRRQLANPETGNITLLAFLSGALCIVPYILVKTACHFCGTDNPNSIQNLLLYSFAVALFTEAPRYLIFRFFIHIHKKMSNVWKCILMSLPFSVGFIFVFLVVEFVFYYQEGITIIRSNASVGLILFIGIISGFFIGMEKTTGARFIHPVLGITTVVILHSITGVSIFLKDYGLLLFFGAGLSFICLLLAYSAYLLRYDITTS